MDVVYEGDDVGSAAAARADVVVLVCAGGAEAAEGVREVLAASAGAEVVVLLEDGADDELLRAVEAGAHGALPLDMAAERLAEAVAGVLAGEAAIPRRVVRRMADDLAARARRREATARTGLSEREQQVLEALADGEPTGSVAARLGLAPATVRRHAANAAKKLGADGRSDALARLRA
jgi:DNA-binding NarL/FixJ family response regulator